MTRRRSVRPRPVDADAMRRAGRVVAEMHDAVRAAARPGATLLDLDRVAREVLARRGATSNFLGYHGYPAVICASVNDTVVHGIPGDRRLEEGDLLSVDCGAVVDGWHGDAAFTMAVGDAGPVGARLIEVADRALARAIEQARPGRRVGDVSRAVERTVTGAGLRVVPDYTGHGIGRAMHEAPDVPNVAGPDAGPRLLPGMAIAIEPIVTPGSGETRTLADGWTVVTTDGSLAAHVEHTVLVTDAGPEVTTRP